jgi:dTMP kinase
MTLAEQREQGKPRGRHIVLEGDEGCGKTTQVERLAEQLRAQGHEVRIIQEPGGLMSAKEAAKIHDFDKLPLGFKLRYILKKPIDGEEIEPLAELHMFLAQRAQLLITVVEPLLAAGVWVLSDRSSTSTLVYQGWGRGLNVPGHPKHVPHFRTTVMAVAKLAPVDLTVILDIPLEQSASRIEARETNGGEALDRFELAGDEFRRAINDGYRRVSGLAAHAIVDGIGTPDEVEKRIWTTVTDWHLNLANPAHKWNPGQPFYSDTNPTR